ncbi:beta-lactamase family protein [Roseomonas sp. NAR14]|uniref:Beta-lactamase family protein n=1 Tax=Roseomonas acroporae TaxID=2937791 RepID=A0A9X2BY18_9PROT|nr:serine hydrolase domain-containing protein [Roseomonas acroporae]MCK8786509.1 beta-lactamase family protein [Roseomonas acroporae]
MARKTGLRRLGRIGAAGAMLALAAMPARAADPLPRAEPGTVGMSAERLGRVGAALRREVEAGTIPGAVVAIARRGKLVHYEAVGYLDRERGTPMPLDAIFAIASMTKPLTGVAALMLLEEGRLALGDPVERFLPQLGNRRVAASGEGAPGGVPGAVPAATPAGPAAGGQAGPATGPAAGPASGAAPGASAAIATVPARRSITLLDLMRHTSGITYGGRGETPVHRLYPASSNWAGENLTGAEFIDRLAAAPLLYQPGTVWDYSLSIDVLGRVVEQVSGQGLGAFLEERLFRPLGMADTGFLVPPEKAARLARALPRDPLTGQPQGMPDRTKPVRFECGGGCAVSTVGDYLRFAQAMLDGGVLDGARVLGPRTVAAMTSDHMGPEIRPGVGNTDPTRAGYGFGLTVAVRGSDRDTNIVGNPGDWSWSGAYGTTFWVDPKERLAVVLMAQAPGLTRQHLRRVINAVVYQAIME